MATLALCCGENGDVVVAVLRREWRHRVQERAHVANTEDILFSKSQPDLIRHEDEDKANPRAGRVGSSVYTRIR